MILVDTSIWARHLRKAEPALNQALLGFQVVTHDFVIGELALGALNPRAALIDFLSSLPRLVKAHESEVLNMIEARQLSGSGVGYVDAHLMASLLLSPGVRLWSADRRLVETASRRGIPVVAR